MTPSLSSPFSAAKSSALMRQSARSGASRTSASERGRISFGQDRGINRSLPQRRDYLAERSVWTTGDRSGNCLYPLIRIRAIGAKRIEILLADGPAIPSTLQFIVQ